MLHGTQMADDLPATAMDKACVHAHVARMSMKQLTSRMAVPVKVPGEVVKRDTRHWDDECFMTSPGFRDHQP